MLDLETQEAVEVVLSALEDMAKPVLIREWEETGLGTATELDEAMKHLGEIVGRDTGIL